LVQCLATELQLPLYYLSLAALRSREDLAGLLDDVRPGSLVLIEDVDCIAAAAERMNQSNEATTDGKQTNTPLAASPPTSESKITPSDLLNYIDGIIASQGRILVMTTNWPEKLDRALTRAGRVDRKWEITYAQKEELLAFHRAATAIGMTNMPKEDFLELLPDKATIADAQALLFRIEPAEVACETA
jgi:chaperone BCS1